MILDVLGYPNYWKTSDKDFFDQIWSLRTSHLSHEPLLGRAEDSIQKVKHHFTNSGFLIGKTKITFRKSKTVRRHFPLPHHIPRGHTSANPLLGLTSVDSTFLLVDTLHIFATFTYGVVPFSYVCHVHVHSPSSSCSRQMRTS